MDKRFERFSMATSVHGFAELYQAKSLFWKTFWIIILGGSFAVTISQMYFTIAQYMDQPTNTEMSIANESEIFYPPLKLCYVHWMFWVDLKKVAKLNMTKEVLLFALNYYNVIYSDRDFNVTEAEINFNYFMNENKVPSIFELYKMIYREVPIKGKNNITDYFDDISIVYKAPYGFLFCYKIHERRMVKYFEDYKETFEDGSDFKLILFSTLDETYEDIKESVTFEEYNQYMVNWIQIKSYYIKESILKQNITNFAPAIILYPNAYDYKSIDIFSENNFYSISFRASVRTLKFSDKTNECLVGNTSLEASDYCKRRCKGLHNKNVCSCLSLTDYGAMEPGKIVCQRGIVFFSNVENSEILVINRTVNVQVCSPTPADIEEYNICKDQCALPCIVWTYDATVSVSRMSLIIRNVSRKKYTNISIEYPFGHNIIIMTEVDAQTWFNFIANVGGLVGIWTGASLISFIQFCYLFCFVDCDWSTYWVWVRKILRKMMLKQNDRKIEDIRASNAV